MSSIDRIFASVAAPAPAPSMDVRAMVKQLYASLIASAEAWLDGLRDALPPQERDTAIEAGLIEDSVEELRASRSDALRLLARFDELRSAAVATGAVVGVSIVPDDYAAVDAHAQARRGRNAVRDYYADITEEARNWRSVLVSASNGVADVSDALFVVDDLLEQLRLSRQQALDLVEAAYDANDGELRKRRLRLAPLIVRIWRSQRRRNLRRRSRRRPAPRRRRLPRPPPRRGRIVIFPRPRVANSIEVMFADGSVLVGVRAVVPPDEIVLDTALLGGADDAELRSLARDTNALRADAADYEQRLRRIAALRRRLDAIDNPLSDLLRRRSVYAARADAIRAISFALEKQEWRAKAELRPIIGAVHRPRACSACGCHGRCVSHDCRCRRRVLAE